MFSFVYSCCWLWFLPFTAFFFLPFFLFSSCFYFLLLSFPFCFFFLIFFVLFSSSFLFSFSFCSQRRRRVCLCSIWLPKFIFRSVSERLITEHRVWLKMFVQHIRCSRFKRKPILRSTVWTDCRLSIIGIHPFSLLLSFLVALVSARKCVYLYLTCAIVDFFGAWFWFWSTYLVWSTFRYGFKV